MNLIDSPHYDCNEPQLIVASHSWQIYGGAKRAHAPLFKNPNFFGKKCYRKRRFIAGNPHRQRSLGAYIIVSDKKRSKHNSEPLNPASPAKTSRLPSHSTMNIVEE